MIENLKTKWVIEEVFKGMTNGFFIELGAKDDITSDTSILENEYQWDGVRVIGDSTITDESLGKITVESNVSNVIHYLSLHVNEKNIPLLGVFFTKYRSEAYMINRWRTVICISANYESLAARDAMFSLLGSNRFTRQKELINEDLYLNDDFINLLNL